MEWTVVTVLIALLGLMVTVSKPIVDLTRSMTKLTVVSEALHQELLKHEKLSKEEHDKLWKHNDHQDERLEDHEKRIGRLEGHEKN